MATVDPHYIKAALNCATRKGIAPSTMLKQAGIDRKSLEQGDVRVKGDHLAQLIRSVWAKLDDEFMNCTKHPCKKGAFAFMTRHVLNYDSLEAILRQGITFYNLFTSDIQMKLVIQDDIATLDVIFSHPECDPDHFFQEFWLVIWHRFSSWIIGRRIPLLQANFTYPEPAHNSELKYLFPCRQHFNCASLSFSFNTDVLSLPPVRTPRDLSQFLRDSPADLITIPGDETSYRSRIRSLLLNQEGAELQCPTLDEIAAGFNFSSQTLRRKLKQEATSYPKIKDDFRRDLAIEKLCIEKLPITEIARLLGFSEPRSFSRAFKQWTGYTPTDFLQFKQSLSG